MRSGRVLIGLFVAAIVIQPAAVRGESPEQAFANGKALLAKGDFRTALQAFAAAARADRGNREYLQNYSMVRRIIVLRERLDTEKDPRRWEYMARGLHDFYVSKGIYQEALSLDKKIHARLNTAWSAAILAETQLAMNMNAEAAAVLAGLDPNKATAATGALYGLALLGQGKTEQARTIAATVALSKNAGPGVIYRVARLHAAVGNSDQALSLLRRCFEGVVPSRLEGLKNHARLCPEFADLASTDAFARVLQTRSKVAESKCSSGSKCAGCPMRGNCKKEQK